MRARGASATDIVVLVVAADDGVMPQDRRGHQPRKGARGPDRRRHQQDRPRRRGPETGSCSSCPSRASCPSPGVGDTITVELSALQNLGVERFAGAARRAAPRCSELKANPEVEARGIVLEANLDTGRGPVATVIVQRGTLRISDPIVAGPAWGRVKALINDHGDHIKEAPPSTAGPGAWFVRAPDRGRRAPRYGRHHSGPYGRRGRASSASAWVRSSIRREGRRRPRAPSSRTSSSRSAEARRRP